MSPQETLSVEAVKADGSVITFTVISRLNTNIDIEYFQHDGILPYVMRKLIQ